MFELKGKTCRWKTTRIKSVLKYNEIKILNVFSVLYTMLYIHGILSPHEDGGRGGVFFSGPVGGLPFHMAVGGTPSYGAYGGSHN